MAGPNRRLFTFSLRTLFIAVTLLCCWLAWQVHVVRQRKVLLNEIRNRHYLEVTRVSDYLSRFPPGTSPLDGASVSTLRTWLGDETIQEIGYRNSMSQADVATLRKLFPEAKFRESEPPLPPCHPGCFPSSTLVTTAERGLQPIETIRVGEALFAFDADGTQRPVNVTSIFTTTNRLVQIETESGMLLTTPTQPLCTSFARQVAAGEIEAGDRILIWSDHRPVETLVLRATETERVARVFNLVLGNSEVFIAGGFLARSKPPAAPVTNPASTSSAGTW